MARRCFPTCFYVFTACLVAAESPTYGLKGQEVKLNPLISGLPDQILWMHNGDNVVVFNGNEQHVYETYENKINLDWHSAQLHITDLRFGDSGVYEVEVITDKNVNQYEFYLQVIDRVAKPTITCEMNSDKSSEVSGLLMCTTESEKPQFEWSSRGDVQYGPELNISLGGELDEQTYSCRVSNALSNETTTFVAKDCYTDKTNVALVAGLTATFIVVIVVGILLYVYRHKVCPGLIPAKGKNDDLENQSTSTQGVDKEVDDQGTSQFDRAPTLPSTQRLVGNVQGSQKEEAQGDEDKPLLELREAGNKKNKDKPENSFSSSPRDETPSHLDQNTISSGAEDAEELPKVAETGVLQYSNESDPAGELTDKTSDLESSAAPEHTDLEKSNDEPENSFYSSPCDETPSHLDQNSISSSAEDAEELPKVAETEVLQYSNPSDPTGELADKTSDLESSAAPEHTDLEMSNDEPENSFSSSPCDETPSHLDQNSISSSAEDTKELPKVAETEVLQYSNESDPAGELADKMSDPESSAAPEHTDKKSDVADVSHNSPNMASVDSAGENKEDVSSVQVKRETDTNFRECDFSGMENKNEPPQEQQPCAVIEHYDSEPTTDDSDASSEGAHSSEENQEECRHVPGEAEIMLSVKTLRSFWENR